MESIYETANLPIVSINCFDRLQLRLDLALPPKSTVPTPLPALIGLGLGTKLRLASALLLGLAALGSCHSSSQLRLLLGLAALGSRQQFQSASGFPPWLSLLNFDSANSSSPQPDSASASVRTSHLRPPIALGSLHPWTFRSALCRPLSLDVGLSSHSASAFSHSMSTSSLHATSLGLRFLLLGIGPGSLSLGLGLCSHSNWPWTSPSAPSTEFSLVVNSAMPVNSAMQALYNQCSEGQLASTPNFNLCPNGCTLGPT